jgi:ABC-2 type transport system permease protein
MMVGDIWTVMWKERKGLLRIKGSRARALLTILVPVLMIAIVAPLQLGREWVDGAWSIVGAFLIPMMLIGITIPESFAGERERHTLETLLASRLPDRAILFGKLGLAVAYGWAMTLLALGVSLVPVNVVHWDGELILFRPAFALADVLLSLLVAGVMANLGVIISLRSETAQGAQQLLMMVLLVPLMALQLVPMLLLSVVPNGRELLRQWLSVDFSAVIIVAVAVLVAANAALLVVVMARFQRARLCLD